jgi:hypothetical protein
LELDSVVVEGRGDLAAGLAREVANRGQGTKTVPGTSLT